MCYFKYRLSDGRKRVGNGAHATDRMRSSVDSASRDQSLIHMGAASYDVADVNRMRQMNPEAIR